MENTYDFELAIEAGSDERAEFCSGDEDGSGSRSPPQDGNSRSVRTEVKQTIKMLVERFGISREDLVSAYDECLQVSNARKVRSEAAPAAVFTTVLARETDNDMQGERFVQQLVLSEDEEEDQIRATEQPRSAMVLVQRCDDGTAATTSQHLGGGGGGGGETFSEQVAAMDVDRDNIDIQREQQGLEELDSEHAKSPGREESELQWTTKHNGNQGVKGNYRLGSSGDYIPLEEKEEVDKMQTLVQSALRVYEASSVNQYEIGQKRRRCFSLEDDLALQPSSFILELLERDQTMVASAIKKYMNQYSVPQREVVDKTGLNQSHLSQHFLHGVTMKRSKRVKLYHWFEDDQKIRTGKPSSADSALNSVLESPKVEGNRRRPRWKWSPISTQILTEAFKKNHFPTRDQRIELARLCNEAELTMNNGSPIRGPEGDTEGITEQRVNTWFTNRRKGLSTPSPTRGSLAVNHGNRIFAHALPPLLRAATPTTPPQSFSSHTTDLERNDGKLATATATLLNHIQPVQTMASARSAMQVVGTPAGAGGGAVGQALPLTTITLPPSTPHTVLAPGVVSLATPASMSRSSTANAVSSGHPPLLPPHPPPPPLQTIAITPEGIPAAVIPPSQLQAILSQVHVSNESSSAPTQIQLANTSAGIFTIPMLHPQKGNAVVPSPHLQTYTVTPSPLVNKPAGSRNSSSISPKSSTNPFSFSSSSPSSCYPSTTLTTLPTFTQSQTPLQASVPTIIGSSQVQALLTTLQAHAKLQGLPRVQFSPTNSLPLTIALPGTGHSDRPPALLVNQGPRD